MAQETFIRHTENATLFKRSDGLIRGRAGDINTKPFDEVGDHRPVDFDSKVEQIRPDVWRFLGARFGITVDSAKGIIRYHPVRGHLEKYYEIKFKKPTALEFQRHHSRLIEFFIDTPDFRISFFFNPKGMKFLIVLKNSTTDTFRFDTDMQGLKRVGRMMVEISSGKVVSRLPSPYMWDSGKGLRQIERPVGEIFNAGELTLTADLTGCVFPVCIDPSASNIVVDIDNKVSGNAARRDWNAGALVTLKWIQLNTFPEWPMLRWNLSSLGIGSVTSASMFLTIFSNVGTWTNINNMRFSFMNCTDRLAWLEGTGTNTVTGDGATFNTFDGVNPWTDGSGTLNWVDPAISTDLLNQSSTDTGVNEIDIQAHIQESVALGDNGIFTVMNYPITSGANWQRNWHSGEAVDPDNWPYVDIVYETAIVGTIPPHLFGPVL